MLKESVKIRMQKEYGKILKECDIAEAIDLYEKVIDCPVDEVELAGIQENVSYALNMFYETVTMEDYDDRQLDVIMDSFINIEPILKKIFLIRDPEMYSIKKAAHDLTCGVAIDKLRLLDALKQPGSDRINFHANPDNYKNSPGYISYILRAYDHRNILAHEARGWSMTEKFVIATDVMVTVLYACYKNKEYINKKYDEKEKEVRINVDDKMQKIVKEYETSMRDGFSFVPVKWAVDEMIGLDIKDKEISMETLRQAMGKEKHLMLKGEAGCGKSTSIEYLEYMDAKAYLKNPKNPIPIKIVLKDNASEYFSIEDYVCTYLSVNADYGRKLLDGGSINLYLDGVNELIGSMEVKKKIVFAIQTFLNTHENTFTVISDREQVEIRIEADMLVLLLRQMDEADITNYIDKKESNPERAQEVKAYAKDMCDNEICFTPILLNFIIEYYKKNNGFPEFSTNLIWEFIESLLEREHTVKKDINAAPGRLDSLLQYIAIQYCTQEDPDAGLTRMQVLGRFKKCSDALGIEVDTNKCLNLALQLGIMVERAGKCYFANEIYRDSIFAIGIENGAAEIDE